MYLDALDEFPEKTIRETNDMEKKVLLFRYNCTVQVQLYCLSTTVLFSSGYHIYFKYLDRQV